MIMCPGPTGAHAAMMAVDAAYAVSGTAAATSAMVQLPQLPADALATIMSHLPFEDLERLRLCCTQFAAAADPFIKGITLRQWPTQPFSISKRLLHICALDIEIPLTSVSLGGGEPDVPLEQRKHSSSSSSHHSVAARPAASDPWQRLESVIIQLPNLRSLSLPICDLDLTLRPRLPSGFGVYLTLLTRLDLDEVGVLPVGVQLPGLHAASFLSNEHPTSLTAIAALAPNLRQLACRRLEISPAVPQAVTAADAGIYSAGSAGMTVTLPAAAAAAEVAVLPYVTHFGGQVVTVVGAGATAQAAAAFGKSFPHLQVLYRVPQVCGSDGKECGYEDLLPHLPRLRAIRGRNWFSSRSWFLIRSTGHLACDAWSHIERLSFHSHSYPDGCSDFLDISKSTQLRHLRLTFNYPYTKASELVRELSELPSLQSLALPAALFCSRCCPEKHYPGLRASLETLAAKPHLARLDLLTLPAATLGTTFHCGHSASVQENMQAFQAKAATARHLIQQQQQQSQQQVQQHRSLELHLAVEDPRWADESYFNRKVAGHPVWGVYVAANEW